MYSFPDLEPVCFSMSSSNCCFLTCIQISQEAGKVVWYSHLLKNFPQFIVMHTIKGFCIVNEAEIDVFLEFSCFFYDSTDVGNLISGSSAFLKCSLYIWKVSFHILLRLSLKNFVHNLCCCSIVQARLTLHNLMNYSTQASLSFTIFQSLLRPMSIRIFQFVVIHTKTLA